MRSCSECIKEMLPDDPRVKSGKYHLCGCNYCDKPTYFRELERPTYQEVQEPWTKNQWDYVQQLSARVLHLQGKVLEKGGYKGKVDKQYIYSTIIEDTNEQKPTES